MTARRILLVALTVLVSTWLAVELGARWRLHKVMAAGWPTPDGSLDSLGTFYPPTQTNDIAHEIERRAWLIGVDVYPRKGADRPDARKLDPRWKNVQDAAKAYIHSALTCDRPCSAALPARFEEYLNVNGAAIDGIAERILSGPVPQWKVDLRRGFAAPLPNLVGHLELVRLLVASSLHRADRGETEKAWQYLHAASRFTDGLVLRPELISQLIVRADAIMIVGAMRRVPSAAPAWALSWPDADLKQRLGSAAAVEAWMAYSPFRKSVLTDLFSAFDDEQAPSPGGRFLSLVFSPYFRLSAANVAAAHRDLLRRHMQSPACIQDVVTETAKQAIPEWNVFGRIVYPGDSLSGSFRRLGILDAHIEGTRLLLDARDVKRRTGHWPATSPARRSTCATPFWSATIKESGELEIRATRSIAEVTTKGAINLPARYAEP